MNQTSSKKACYLETVKWKIDIFDSVKQQVNVRQTGQKLCLQHQCN